MFLLKIVDTKYQKRQWVKLYGLARVRMKNDEANRVNKRGDWWGGFKKHIHASRVVHIPGTDLLAVKHEGNHGYYFVRASRAWLD